MRKQAAHDQFEHCARTNDIETLSRKIVGQLTLRLQLGFG
jgi:hypothetical protein